MVLGALFAGGVSLLIPGCLRGEPPEGAAPEEHAGGSSEPLAGAPAFPFPRPSLPLGVPAGSPESWRFIGALVRTLRFVMPSPARSYTFADPSVQVTARQLYYAAQRFINADFNNPYAAQAAASQLHAAAQQHSLAVANAVQGAPSGPPPPVLPPGRGLPPGGGPPIGIPPGRRYPVGTAPEGAGDTASPSPPRAEDTGEAAQRFFGPCPPVPFWAWCLCNCDKSWEICVSSTPPFWWWWCDLVYWWCTFWC
jgi:hypothetical protein